ncbi:MAG: glycosyl transferase, group 2 family protein [Conexibacter sp.]|nr:glycosyl transferase, group 2 family protein [Conexibacter sp.]
MSAPHDPIETPPPLGEALEYAGLIDRETLVWALARKRETGQRLGAILVNCGLVHRMDLQRVLGAIWGIPFVDLLNAPLDAALARRCDPQQLLAEGWFPLRLDGDRVVVATCEPPSGELIATVRETLDLPGDALGAPLQVELRTTTPLDVERAVTRCFEADVVQRSTAELRMRRPEQSAASGLSAAQRGALLALAAAVAGALVLTRDYAFAVLVLLGEAILLGATALRLAASLVPRRAAVAPRQRPAWKRHDRELPVYTVLVPVYREANVIGELLEHLGRLDYPAEKLELIVLLESDDAETIAAARAARPPSTVRLVVVPDAAPRTKPKACNVGLFLARGELLAVYDAEDRPAPGQLRAAVAAFEAAGERTLCVQARLRFWNAPANLLTRLSGLECDHWQGAVLPALERVGVPVPPSGTSIHFRVAALRELGGWDPHNMCGHAAFGVRAPADGYRVGLVDSTTDAEACARVGPWLRQRSRWLKGYLQTALISTRHPVRLVRHVGLGGALGYLAVIAGTPLALLLTPVLWVGVICWYGFGMGDVPFDDPAAFWRVALLGLIVANAMKVAMLGIAAVRDRGWRWMPYALLAPFYSALQSLAAWRALIQLVRNPFLWETTPHALAAKRGADRRRGDGRPGPGPRSPTVTDVVSR